MNFKVSSTSNFANSFSVELYDDQKNKVGHFKYAITDDGINSEAKVNETERNKGYGKMLLLKAIKTANDNDLDFAQDTRSVSKEQLAVYDSLKRDGYIESKGLGYILTDDGEDFLSSISESFSEKLDNIFGF